MSSAWMISIKKIAPKLGTLGFRNNNPMVLRASAVEYGKDKRALLNPASPFSKSRDGNSCRNEIALDLPGQIRALYAATDR